MLPQCLRYWALYIRTIYSCPSYTSSTSGLPCSIKQSKNDLRKTIIFVFISGHLPRNYRTALRICIICFNISHYSDNKHNCFDNNTIIYIYIWGFTTILSVQVKACRYTFFSKFFPFAWQILTNVHPILRIDVAWDARIFVGDTDAFAILDTHYWEIVHLHAGTISAAPTSNPPNLNLRLLL